MTWYRFFLILVALWSVAIPYSCMSGLGVFDGSYERPESAAANAGFAVGFFMNFMIWAAGAVVLILLAMVARRRSTP